MANKVSAARQLAKLTGQLDKRDVDEERNQDIRDAAGGVARILDDLAAKRKARAAKNPADGTPEVTPSQSS